MEGNLCFTVWQEDQTGHQTVIRQGCFTSLPGLGSTPTCSSRCEDNTTTIRHVRDSQLLFCCCNKDNCNKHFEWNLRNSSEGRS